VPIRKLGSVIPYVHIEPIKIGPLALQPFGVLVALGVIIGYSLALRRARRLGVDVIQLRSFIGWILLCGFVFATSSTQYFSTRVRSLPDPGHSLHCGMA